MGTGGEGIYEKLGVKSKGFETTVVIKFEALEPFSDENWEGRAAACHAGLWRWPLPGLPHPGACLR
jgi:hypothetical protein